MNADDHMDKDEQRRQYEYDFLEDALSTMKSKFPEEATKKKEKKETPSYNSDSKTEFTHSGHSGAYSELYNLLSKMTKILTGDYDESELYDLQRKSNEAVSIFVNYLTRYYQVQSDINFSLYVYIHHLIRENSETFLKCYEETVEQIKTLESNTTEERLDMSPLAHDKTFNERLQNVANYYFEKMTENYTEYSNTIFERKDAVIPQIRLVLVIMIAMEYEYIRIV